MAILVINCGSTSIKIAVLDPHTGQQLGGVHLERLGGSDPGVLRWHEETTELACDSNHERALSDVLPLLLKQVGPVHAVGHRVVHGGETFRAPTVLDDAAEQAIEGLTDLAPLHNPVNLAGIRAARRQLPDIPHVAVFDTAFHSTLPTRARLYAIDRQLAARHGIRRYGFHGTSHQFVAHRVADFLGESLKDLRLITCHLGGGCSICAIEYGRSVETSMGMTPLEGVVMATRSGDVDVGAIMHLMRAEDLDPDATDLLLNKGSGLAGLSGVGSDMRDIERGAEEGDEHCREALQVFCHRVRKYIGGYAAVMGGVDAIAFTGGIGENSAVVRHRVAQRLDFLGARLDETVNREIQLSDDTPIGLLSQPHSRVRMMAVKTDEMLSIAQQVNEHLHETLTTAAKPIPVAISARHVHLTQETVEALFGPGHTLTPYKPLSQPGQFASEERVTLVGPKRSIERVRVLGPTRSKNQVEISRTDEFYLGIDAPVRASGQIENTPGITLVGSEGRTVEIQQGVICALRHIHMTPDDAAHFGVQDGDLVDVEVGSDGVRSLTFGDVLIRVKSSYALEMHIDTDEGNAAELMPRDTGELERTEGQASLTGRSQH